MNKAATTTGVPFDAREFRSALGTFTTGVTIVTTRDADGNPVGVTANSFNSVSLEPPMILWSLARNARSLVAFENAGHWVVHILAADQEALSNRFARSGGDKFAGLEFEHGESDAPLLPGCACRLQCTTAFRYEGGDHVIFVGQVVRFDRRDVPALAFQAGKYALTSRMIEPEALSGSAPRESDISYGEDFLGYLLWRAHLHFRSRVQTHLDRQNLDTDSFMILAMLLHHDGRSLAQLQNGLLRSGPASAAESASQLAQRGLIRIVDEGAGEIARLTDQGRDLTLHVHAVSQSIEADLIGLMEPSEGLAFKHLLRRFILRTDPGLPHPWQS